MKNGKVMFEGKVEQMRQLNPNAGQSLESLYLAMMDS
jgi:hypothetical protein